MKNKKEPETVWDKLYSLDTYSRMMKDFNDKVDNYIIDKLKSLGHTFITRSELIVFIQENIECVINSSNPNIKNIFLKEGNDRIHLLTYSDKIDLINPPLLPFPS